MTYPEFETVCFLADKYNGVQDFDNMYLGKRQLPIKAELDLTAMFTGETLKFFYDWWITETNRGTEIFVIKIMLFDKVETYGVRQISELKHTRSPGDLVQLRVQLLFDASEENIPPVAHGMSLYMNENSGDNYVYLRGTDPDGDPLTYNVTMQPAFGVLRGTPPNVVYTPDSGYTGEDCFNFTCSDQFATSLTATVEITVGTIILPVAQFEYEVNGQLTVKGNYFYDAGDGVIVQGIGGVINPIGTTITIWSNDHVFDNPEAALELTVINWGTRTNFTSFCEGMKNLRSFSVNSAVGSCKGEIFTKMFKDFPFDPPGFDTSNGIYFNSMFEGAGAEGLGIFELKNGIYFQQMFKDSAIHHTQKMNTIKGQYFQEMFMNTPITCITFIDTKQQINTLKMFYNTPNLVQPDAVNQANILQGVSQPFSGALCKFSATITETKRARVNVDAIDGSGVAAGTYTIATPGAIGVKIYNWTTSSGTITSGQGTATVNIQRSISASETFNLKCVVTDQGGAGQRVDSGWSSFKRDYHFTGLTLWLPKYYSLINLRTYINANNPSNKKNIVVYNNRDNATTTTGNLSGLNVKFVNNGKLFGIATQSARNAFEAKNNGFTATSALQFVNNGYVYGCGGNGGHGGKGANDSYNKTSSTTQYQFGCGSGSSWGDHDGTNWVTLTWNGKWCNRSTTGTGPLTHDNYSGKFYRSSYKCRGYCETWGGFYAVRREITTKYSRTGGNGGAGGKGASYNQSATWNHSWRIGKKGVGSSPSGGNTGGTGGAGGWWGNVGYNGERSGSSGHKNGYTAGKAIQGSGWFKANSKIGNTGGAVT